MKTTERTDDVEVVPARVVCGVFLVLAALFSFLSMGSFLFTWIHDQSLLTDPDYITNGVNALNWGGKLGYSMAHFLFARLFGFGAFSVPVFLAFSSVACFNVRKVHLGRILFLCLFGCIAVSLTCAFIGTLLPSLSSIFERGAGGSYGYYVNEWACSMLGKTGAGFSILFLDLLWGVLLSRRVAVWLSHLVDRIFAPRIRPEKPAAGTEESLPEEDGASGTEEFSDDISSDDSDMGGSAADENDPRSADIPLTDIQIPVGVQSVEEGDAPERNSVVPDAGSTSAFDVIHTKMEDEVLSDDGWKARYDPRLSLSHYRLPSTDLLDNTTQNFVPTMDELRNNNQRIIQALKSYKIAVTRVSAKVGPTVTLFEVVPASGVKVSQIKSREEDIARELAAIGVRVVFLPGSNAIGIEVANAKPSTVSMRSILEDHKFRETKMELPVAIGRTISNEAMIFDLAKMPHLLVAGATGQGKSVGLNALITSLLYKKHPSELKFVLVDPKKVELSLYSPIENHYLAKLPESEEAIITDTDRVVYTLRSLCKLMDRRYDLLKAARVRNIKEYNEKFLSRQLNPEKGHEFMPYIVVIIDEFSDLLMTAGKDVEDPITRLAQLARAIGIHLVIATQRPTTNIITGTIKANFPARIAFKVMTGIDSKTILDQTGANRLIGRGDMLLSTGSMEPIRVQCAFIDTHEVAGLAEFIHSQPGFGTAYLLPDYNPELDGGSGASQSRQGGKGSDRDELFEEAARLIVREQLGSTSLLQRKLNVGFPKAGRLMDQLEEAGIVGPSEGSKPRQVRVSSMEALERILGLITQ